MTTQQEPPRIEERVARIEGAITDIPRQLEAQNRTIDALRAEMRESIDALRAEMRESDDAFRTEMRESSTALIARMDVMHANLSAKSDAVNATFIRFLIGILITLVGGIVVFVATQLARLFM